MRAMGTIVVALAVALAVALGGCATTQPEPVPVVDTFCLTAKKRSWHPDEDSIASMREAVVYNKMIDKRCGIPGQKG